MAILDATVVHVASRSLTCGSKPRSAPSGFSCRDWARVRLAGSEEVVADDGLVPAGADADGRDAGPGQFLQALDVGTRVAGQLLESPAFREVLPPAGQLFVDRDGVVHVGLRHRHVVGAEPVDLVADADRHLL